MAHISQHALQLEEFVRRAQQTGDAVVQALIRAELALIMAAPTLADVMRLQYDEGLWMVRVADQLGPDAAIEIGRARHSALKARAAALLDLTQHTITGGR